MPYVAAILILILAEWATVPMLGDDPLAWQLVLGVAHGEIAILWMLAASLSSKQSLLVRSAILLMAINAVLDVFIYAAWQATGTAVDGSIPLALLTAFGITHILYRNYDTPSDKVKRGNVAILLLKPRDQIETALAFFGSPVASICIVAHGKVYAFRHASGCFEASHYSTKWLTNHIAIDTGVQDTEAITGELEKILGENRGFGIKCIYAIKGVLEAIGGKYAVASPFDYVPGIYAARILRRGD